MSAPAHPSRDSLDPERFPYGWRPVRRLRADGTEETDFVPLTLEDVLHPQEDDHIPENSQHEALRRHFHDVVSQRLVRRPTCLSLSDCLVEWDRDDLRGHSPDLIVLERKLPWPWRKWTKVHVGQEHAWPVLIIEIVSASTRRNDVDEKVKDYHRAGVPIYVIVDEVTDTGPLRLIGYRHAPGGYAPVPLDAQGRLFLEPLTLHLVVVGDRVALFDAATGEELGDWAAIYEQMQAEKKARAQAEKERDEATARADAEKVRAEAEKARADAEKARAETETKARAQAEEKASAEAAARQAAERAHAELQTQFQAMQAELQRLRGG